MGKIVSIDLDPALVADYERVAGEQGRSLEAELARALVAQRPRLKFSREELIALVHDNWCKAPWLPGYSDSTALLREDRDSR